MSIPRRTAWLRTEKGFAIVCSWCDDALLADERARRAGLPVSHGICPECAREKLGVEIDEHSFAPVVPFPAQVGGGVPAAAQNAGYSCTVGSATARRDERNPKEVG